MAINVLNSPPKRMDEESVTPEELSRRLQKTMLELKADHMGPEGRGVDYQQLTSSKLFTEYVCLSSQLITCDPSQLSEESRMAFFINIYNCLTIHGLASVEQLPGSVLELSEFWKKTAYSINSLIFSLDDIEHGILRGNRPHPTSTTPPFGEKDPRRALAMKKCDPRIHFTLVCGAKSCPAIQVYSEKNLERGLSQAAGNFCAQEVEVDPAARKVRLSKIFQWYRADFAPSERHLLECIREYVPEETKTTLNEMLSSQDPIHIQFKDYDWKLNKL